MKVILEGKKVNGQLFEKSIDINQQWLDLYDQDLLTIDLNSLKSCHYLKKIELNENKLNTINLNPIVNNTELHSINLSSNQFNNIDLSSLGECKNLKKISLAGNILSSIDLNPLGNCYQLEKLDIRSNRLTSINLEPIRKCLNLKELKLAENYLSDIDLTPLSNCKQLEKIDLDDNQLTKTNLAPLSNCKNIKELFLKRNQLKNINLTPLSGNESLTWLDLRNNELEKINLTPLMNCTGIERLELEKNPLKSLNLAPLSNCSNLTWVNITFNQLNAIEWNAIELDSKKLPDGLKPHQTIIREAWEKFKQEENERIQSGEFKKKATIAILGARGSGKTTLCNYLKSKIAVEIKPKTTLGLEYHYNVINQGNISLTIIDVGGQEIHRKVLWLTAMSQANAIIYIIDGVADANTNPQFLDYTKESFDFVLKNIQYDVPLLILVNKLDLMKEETYPVENVSKYFDILNITNRISSVNYISAKYGFNVIESIDWLIEKIDENIT